MKKSNINIFAFCISLLCMPHIAMAQDNCQYFGLSTFTYLYLLSDSKDEGFFANNEAGVNNLFLEKIGIPVASLKPGEYRISQFGDSEILFYCEAENLVRPYDIILKNEKYILLSPKHEAQLCDYDENITLFIPERNYLNSTETFFSMSLKKDLAKKLSEELNINIDPKLFRNICEMLAYLKTDPPAVH